MNVYAYIYNNSQPQSRDNLLPSEKWMNRWPHATTQNKQRLNTVEKSLF